MIRVQIARLPDGRTFFSIGRTIRKHRGGFHAPEILYAIELGCDIDDDGYSRESSENSCTTVRDHNE